MPNELSLTFRVFEREGFVVALSGLEGDAAPIEAPFDVDWRDARDAANALSLIDGGLARLEHLQAVGSQLWASLLAGDLGKRVEALRKEQARSRTRIEIRLDLPPIFASLPWEALYDMRQRAFVATHPLCSIVRHTDDATDVLEPGPRRVDKLRVLVVIPEGSELHVDHELKRIQLALQSIGRQMDGGGPRRVDGRVTPDRLRRELAAGHHVVHFIGHGRLDEAGVAEIRLNDDEGRDLWVRGEALSPLFARSPADLVFLNCCLGGLPSPNKQLAGLGPILLAAGVPAVVAMRYEIRDDVAIDFASAFYRELVSGSLPGRVDVAVASGREAVLLNHSTNDPRGFIVPQLYLARGREALFTLPALEPAAPRPSRRATSIAVPRDLVTAVAQGRCVPIIGPGLVSALRSGEAAPIGVRGLAERLAKESDYPEMNELLEGERVGDWYDSLVLQRVCQHYERWAKRRPKLTSAVLSAYVGAREPPQALLSLASWTLPGLVCTHFDGLVLLAFEQAKKGLYRVANAVDQPLGAAAERAALLVHLRGSVRAPDSLVLTEEDHDDLADRLARLSPEIASLVTGEIDRSLLLLGVSPRDPWIKRLARRLVPESAVNAGPVYFACPSRSSVDEACWQSLHVEWIDASAEALVEELTLAASAGAGR